MLKIKDNIELKELENFGFEYCSNPQFMELSSIYSDLSDISFDIEDRIIDINLESVSINCHNIEQLDEDYENITNSYRYFKEKIEELIELGLVEKVSD